MAKLNPHLKDFWRTRADVRVLKGGRASSKCLALGTRVLMHDNTVKSIEDISVGEQVMGPDGNPRNVMATGRGVEQMYTVKQFYGDDYTVNASHILSVKKREGVKNDKGPMYASGNYKRPRGRYPDYPDIWNVNIEEFMACSDRIKGSFRGYKSGLIDFPEASLPIDPYFMGIWLGDGDSSRASITTADQEILDYLKTYAGAIGESYAIEKDPRSNAIRFRFQNLISPQAPCKMWGMLKDSGAAVPRDRKNNAPYVNNKHIPHEYLTSSEEQRLRLLAGLIDSDGTYLRDRRSMVIGQKLERLANDVKRLCNSLGFRTTTRTDIASCNGKKSLSHVVTISGNLHRIPCVLPRKQADVVRANDDFLTNTLRFEDAGVGEYAGISVDGDCLYLLEDHTVVHNTWDAAGIAIFLASQYTLKFLAIRQYQNKIQESVYAILLIQIERFGMQDEFEILKTSIVHKATGSSFHFYGMNRNVAEIKGFEGADICWIEEGEGLTSEQWGIIEPTVRKEGSQIWILFNPRLVSDFVITNFKHDPDNHVIVRHINYDENPFISEKMLRTIERLKERDYEEYEHIYLGVPRNSDDQAVIKRSWVEAAIDAHIKLDIDPAGSKRIGFDIADSGADLCSQIYAHGIVALWGENWKAKEDELLHSCTRVYNKAIEYGASVDYDSIGVGASAGSKFNELNEKREEESLKGRVSHSKFNAGAKVIDPDGVYIDTGDEKIINKDHFANLKAQAWWLVADRFRNTYNAVVHGDEFDEDELISISSDMPNLEDLITQLSTPHRHFDNAGRVKVESKDDLAKRDIASPNDADAFIMAFAPREKKSVGFFDIDWSAQQ